MDTIQAFEAPSLLLREPKRRSAGQAISSITNYYTQYLIRKHPLHRRITRCRFASPFITATPSATENNNTISKLTLLLGWSIS